MKKILLFLSLSTFLATPIQYISANDDYCHFMSEIDEILETKPSVALKNKSLAENGEFIAVGDAIVPSFPGFSDFEEQRCVSKNHGFTMVWAGGDAYGCEGQDLKAAQMAEYAKEYNLLQKYELTKENNYQCTQEKLEIVRNNLCKKTGHAMCTGNEDWDGAFDALNKFGRSFRRHVSFGYKPDVYGEYWGKTRDIDNYDKIKQGACKLLPQFNIQMPVTLHMKFLHNNTEHGFLKIEELDDIVCLKGTFRDTLRQEKFRDTHEIIQ